jgi:hypothetical protein
MGAFHTPNLHLALVNTQESEVNVSVKMNLFIHNCFAGLIAAIIIPQQKGKLRYTPVLKA